LRGAITFTDRIEVNPRVMLGKAVIRGTRIPVEPLLCKLSEGASEVDLLEAYPQLTRGDIHAAMRYAADTLAHEEVVFIEKLLVELPLRNGRPEERSQAGQKVRQA
jgi:uncharacterized protein (DUF433 family)